MPTATVAPTTYLNFIDGEWRASRSGRTFENINPADTRDVVGLLQDSDASDVDAAVQAAQKAFPGWASMPAPARGKILLKAAAILEGKMAEMADLLSREEGKTIGEAKGEVTRAVRILEYFGGEGARMSGQTIPSERPRVFMYTIRQPLGVVALIAPWNFPIAIPTWKMAPALVSGNAVVFKPASQAPLTSLELVEDPRAGRHPQGRPEPRRPDRDRASARRSSRIRWSGPSRSPARTASARASPRSARSGWRASSWRWAARTRPSCSPTRTWTSPSTAC